MGAVTTLIQPVGGLFSDRMGRKLFIVIDSLLTIIAFSLYLVAGRFSVLLLLIPTVALWGAASIGTPAFQSTVAESVAPTQRGRAYSTIVFCSLIPGVVTAAIGGHIADVVSYETVFFIGILLESVVLALIILFLKETLRPGEKTLRLGDMKRLLGRFLIPNRVRGFYVAMAVDFVARGLGAAIIYGLLRQTYHFSNLQLGIMSSISLMAWAAFQLPAGRLVDRYGSKKFLVFAEVIGMLLVSGWLVAKSFEAFALLHVLNGLLSAAWVPSMQTFLVNSFPKHERAEAAGKLAAFRGVIGFSAPLIGGLLYDSMGFTAPISVSLAVTAVALILILLWVHEPSRSHIED